MKSCKGFINFWFGCQIYAGTASYFKRPFCFDRYIIYMLKTYNITNARQSFQLPQGVRLPKDNKQVFIPKLKWLTH